MKSVKKMRLLDNDRYEALLNGVAALTRVEMAEQDSKPSLEFQLS